MAVRRREFMSLLGGAAAAVVLGPLDARAQPPSKPRRIGILAPDPAGGEPTSVFQAFLRGMRELGWAEGQNLAIEWRFVEPSYERLPALAAELVAAPVDLIVASTAVPARAAKEATGTIPVVFIQVPDPVALGIVTNLARPGTNVTGLSSIASDLTGKRLALVKEILPDAMNIAVLWNRPSEGSALVFHEMKRIKGQVGLELEDVGVSDARELQEAFASAARARVAAVMVIDDPVMTSRRGKVVQLAGEHALPVFSQYSEYVDDGGLISYGPSLTAIYRRGAIYVDRILKGAKPGELPVEPPVVFEMVINLRTAKALGLELAPTLVARADRVIE
jgi:putative tryptophan/tyrosine transport system substrate-binding protein